MTDVTAIYESDLPVEFRSENMYGVENFEGKAARFRQWCEDNDVFYYARPRESFFRQEAFELAAAAGYKYVLMEDLS